MNTMMGSSKTGVVFGAWSLSPRILELHFDPTFAFFFLYVRAFRYQPAETILERLKSQQTTQINL